MITLTGGGVTITVTKEDAAFYMRLGYVPSTGSGTAPLPASPFFPPGTNGEESESAVPTAPTEPLPTSPLHGEELKKRKKK